MGTTRIVATSALFGRTRQAVLGLLYTHDAEALYLRQIVRAVLLGQGSVQRELAHLTAAGLLTRTQRGNQVYYQANRGSPVFAELKSLIIKTVGVGDVLRAALEGFSDRLQVAFLYGSLASGVDTMISDVDLLVVGRVTFGEVAEAVGVVQERLRREVNPSVYSAAEFRKKVLAGHHFLTDVLKGPKIFLIGGELELKRLGSKRLAD